MVGFDKHGTTASGRFMWWSATVACAMTVAACEQAEPPVNAAQQSSIDNAMEEVDAAQARSDINVAEVKAVEDRERQVSREKQQAATKDAE